MSISSYEYKADIPVSVKNEDEFNRYGFAKRIAKTISSRDSADPLVIGLYAKWGSGKTSIMKFIETELQTAKVIIVNFNPWLYKTEQSLLIAFFNAMKLAVIDDEKKLGTEENNLNKLQREYKKFRRKAPLKSPIGQAIQELAHSDLVQLIPKVGEAADKFIDQKTRKDLNKLKGKLKDALKLANKKIVILIDDIDRLQHDEIHFTFRLIKLLGNFPFTTYMLAFDDKFVANSLGQSFGDSSPKSGKEFLEKIIQVPLQLPEPRRIDLRKFLTKNLKNTLQEIGIELERNEREISLFESIFFDKLFFLVTSPRRVIRFINAVAFSIPMLDGLSNLTDLLILESIKIFFPELYDIIKRSKYCLIEMNSISIESILSENSENFKQEIENTFKEMREIDKRNVIEVLVFLFPFHTQKEVLSTRSNIQFSKKEQLKIEKRLASPDYFDRYFSYSLSDEDLSDIELDSYFNDFLKNDQKESFENLGSFISDNNSYEILNYVRSRLRTLNWDDSKKLVSFLSKTSEIFKRPTFFLSMQLESEIGLASLIVYDVLDNNQKEEDMPAFLKETISSTREFYFAHQICRSVFLNYRKHSIFNEDSHLVVDMIQALLERALKDSKGKVLFEFTPQAFVYLFFHWKETNESSFDDYINSYLEKDTNNVFYLIKAHVPMARSTEVDGTFKADLTKPIVERLAKLYSVERLQSKIELKYDSNIIENEPPLWMDSGEPIFSEINMIRQFYHLNSKRENTIDRF